MELAPWSLTTESEEWVKDETKKLTASTTSQEPEEISEKGESKSLTGAAKTLCIPFNQPPMPEGTLCFTGNNLLAKEWCLWGRSY
jgi:prolyl-tRNA synthetase